MRDQIISGDTIRAITDASGCSSATIARYLAGVAVYGATRVRIERALRKIKRLDLVRNDSK